jgi:Ca2+-binding RTX toxin-like protein
LDGSITFQFGNQTQTANPGDIVAIPEGNLHGWRNLGDKPARMIVFSTPSGDIENTFREAGDPVTDPLQPLPGDPLKVEETFAKHDTDSYPEADLVGKPPVTDGGQIFYGKEYSETITGSDGSDTILGRNGQDRLHGGLGNDTLTGGTSNDLLDGGQGDDLLSPSEGNDTLVGGFGIDTLTGGKGSDLFFFESGEGTDTITDFKDSEDLIGLSGELTFTDIKIVQGTGDNANDTLINLSSSNETLAILSGIQENMISSDDFHLVSTLY